VGLLKKKKLKKIKILKKKWFVALSEIPHGSGKLNEAIEWYLKIGKLLKAEYVKKDSFGNISMKFPASSGKEKAPGIVLQGHIDMVCTKSQDLVFNFEKDPIKMIIDGEWLHADQTTLGGDDGIGVACGLAIAEDNDKLIHGSLEILLTTDEEIGLIGACGLKEGELLSDKAKYLLNIDSEDFGEICISCAGAVMRKIHIPVIREKVNKDMIIHNFSLKNLTGGHSGVEIHVGRGNALKWMMKMIADNSVVLSGSAISLIEFAGGNAHNAIPSYCTAKIAVPKDNSGFFLNFF
jgi:dipeptidase D